MNEVRVKVAMKPIRTIGQYLPSPKDPITTDEITCIVYEVPCKDSDFVYVACQWKTLAQQVYIKKMEALLAKSLFFVRCLVRVSCPSTAINWQSTIQHALCLWRYIKMLKK